MSEHLPPNHKRSRKDAFYSMILAPLEYITNSLRKGDGWEVEDLRQLRNRCRALADAFDARENEIKEGK